jgi:hypothetical protein
LLLAKTQQLQQFFLLARLLFILFFLHTFFPRAMARLLVLSALALIIFGGCMTDDNMNSATPGTYYGETAPFGTGTIQSWTVIGPSGAPTAMGVTFSEAAYVSLQRDSDMMMMLMFPAVSSSGGGMMSMMNYMPFDHVSVNWVPDGDHEPPYDSTHLDCHFYVTTTSMHMGMMGGRDSMMMDMKHLPKGYMQDSISEERMGVHCMDTSAKEFHGGGFDMSFVYGVYHGSLVFMETMFATKVLDAKTSMSRDIKQPTAFATSGYYPTKYNVTYDATAKTYSIQITDFVLR